VLVRDLADRAHELLVLALGVVDHGDGRARDGGEHRGLAGVVHSDLDHRGTMRGAKAQQRQRQADRVVEVARGRQHRRVAEVRAQDGRDHLLDRRLAVAADHRDQRQREPLPPPRGKASQRRQRVGDDDQVPGQRLRARLGDHRCDGAARKRLGDEVVAVEALAGERPRRDPPAAARANR